MHLSKSECARFYLIFADTKRTYIFEDVSNSV
jgi:hypothetical protein